MKEKKDYFHSRYAFLFAIFGMAIDVGILTSINGIPSAYFLGFLIIGIGFGESGFFYHDTWRDPFVQPAIGTCIFLWIIVIFIGVSLNEKISDSNFNRISTTK
jgi:hypothetical protein